jgi:hypothetical protein
VVFRFRSYAWFRQINFKAQSASFFSRAINVHKDQFFCIWFVQCAHASCPVVQRIGVTPARAEGILYVKTAASEAGNCSSWANACTLQTALTDSGRGDEIWVALGTHKPTTLGADRGATFQLKGGVAVYGGFKGTETARDQRKPAVSTTQPAAIRR